MALPLFELIPVTPNTDDWLKVRKGPVNVAIGSSAMGAAAGINSFKTRFEMLHELVYGSTFKGNAATEHGHRFEGVCAAQWSAWNDDTPTFEVGVCRPTSDNWHFVDSGSGERGYPYFGVSIDRWACKGCSALDSEATPDIREHASHKGFCVIECKCPFTLSSFQRYYEGKVKHEHLAQLHLQMAVLGLREIEYMVTLVCPKSGAVKRARWSRVYFSQSFWDWIYPKALEVALTAVECTFLGIEPEASLLSEITNEMYDDLPSVEVEQRKSI